MASQNKSPQLSRIKEIYSVEFPLLIEKRDIPVSDMKILKKPNLHWHNYFEIEIVSRGACLHIGNEAVSRLQRGSAYLIRPSDFHNIFPNEAPFTLYHIIFELPVISTEIASHLSSVDTILSVQFTEQEMGFLEEELRIMIENIRPRGPWSRQLLRAGLEQILLLIFQKAEENAPANDPVSQPQPLIQRVVAYIQFHFRNTLHIYDVAQIFHVSAGYLGELFTQTMGIRFQDYLTDLRLEYARNLLLTTDLTVSQIGMEAGFHTTSHFIKCFRKKFDTTPHALRTAGKP